MSHRAFNTTRPRLEHRVAQALAFALPAGVNVNTQPHTEYLQVRITRKGPGEKRRTVSRRYSWARLRNESSTEFAELVGQVKDAWRNTRATSVAA
jgi:hypothetical protein